MTPNNPAQDVLNSPAIGNPKTGEPGDARATGNTGDYPLTPLQEGMLFQWQIDRHSGTDIEQIVGRLHEAVDAERLNAAWQQAAASYSTLRTTFKWEGLASPVQRVQPSVVVPFATHDLRGVARDDAEARIAKFLETDRRDGFDLANAPAMRVTLFQLADTEFRIVWSVHHILIDGRSFEVVLNAVFAEYDGTPHAVIDRPYSEYTNWIASHNLSEPRAFWKQKLDGFSAPTPTPADINTNGSAEKFHHRWSTLSKQSTDALRETASREGLTLNTLVMSAWGLMLSRYSNEQDIVFGATKTTRRGTIADADSVLGVFLATIPVRLTVNADTTVREYLQHVRAEWVAMRGAEHLPLVEIRQASGVRSSRLFDSLVVFENYQFGTRLKQQGGAWSNRHFGILEQTGFPLTLSGYGDDELALRIEYDANRFSSALIDRMISHLSTLLDRFAGDLSSPLWGASMLSVDEEQLVLREWNNTAREYPRDAFIDDLFGEQAALRPNAIALECEEQSMTYAELDKRATEIAARLRHEGVEPGNCVGLFAERSIELIVAALGIIRAGAAYLPFEPGYPKDRLLFMIEDAGAKVVLTPSGLADAFDKYISDVGAPPRVLLIDAPHDANIAAFDQSPAARAVALERAGDAGSRIAYVMYTSGSSGLPKGVAVPHRGAVRLVRNTTYMDFTADDAMLALATTMFDLSTWEFWSALLNGGRLVLLPGGQIDPAKIADLIERKRVTMMWNTPALFQQIVDYGLDKYSTVRLFAIAGDIVPVPHLKRAVAALPNCQFVNGYGPTENSVFTCAYRVPKNQPVEDPLPIGPPLTNSTVYVLDAHGAPTAVGVPGELYTGGDGVAVRYLNREELTAERFLKDPFSSVVGAQMYRTGDGAKWRADGVVEFLGRLDNQVKIRGYRIEPGEIESVMTTLPGVRVAAVAVRKDAVGQKRLLGYYVAEEGQTFTPADVRTTLRALLPDYMIPVSIMALDELPQTNSGKIDRKALPEPVESEDANREANWKSRPLGRSQTQLANIWENLLGRTGIGIDDDFFELGGHSLLAVRMMNEAERILGRRLALTALLEKPTIRYLAKKIDAAILADPEPEMVVLNAQGGSTPLVFVHGDLTGGGWYCRRLSSLIGESVPMIVMPTFRPPSTGETWTIETMAAMHVRALRTVRPQGPYRVGGFCAGGLIALEIARELERQGETVEQVVLVDSVNQNAHVSRWRPLIDRMAPPTPMENQYPERQRLLGKFKYYDARLREVRSMGPVGIARWATNTVRIRLPGARVNAATSVSDRDHRPKTMAIPERENLLFYSRAQSVYVPKRYAGSVDMIFSSDPTDQASNASDPVAAAEALKAGYAGVERGWRPVLPGARVQHIPGTHIGMIVDNLDQLGRCLRSCLKVTDH